MNVGLRQFKPIQQVAARIEVCGPGRLWPSLCGGVDVRGDGSIEPFVGRFSRSVVEVAAGESPLQALRRALRVGDRAAG